MKAAVGQGTLLDTSPIVKRPRSVDCKDCPMVTRKPKR